jgi:hypothetical protein
LCVLGNSYTVTPGHTIESQNFARICSASPIATTSSDDFNGGKTTHIQWYFTPLCFRRLVQSHRFRVATAYLCVWIHTAPLSPG